MKAKRFLAILLCILLVGSVFPAGVIAEEMVVDTEIALEEAAQEGEDIQEITMPETEAAAESMEEEPQTPPEEIPEPAVSEAPVTEAPVTEAPVTEAPVTEAPAIEAPVTEAPVTEQVVTEPVATEAPVTEPVLTERVEIEQAAGEEAAFGDVPDTDPEENPVTEKSYPAFNQSMTVDGVTVTVSAQEGTFPEGAMLSVVSVPTSQVESDIEKERDEEQNVVVSYTFDIKVLDKDGTELQPADDKPVQVSFRTAEVADPNLETNVYHVPEEGEVETLDVDVSGSTAITETDGFSLYTVEFTYNNLEYVLQGGSHVPLQDILTAVGLVGEATGAQVSNAELFSVSNETGEWVVTSHKPFSSEEWLKVTIDERDYQITVTDDNETSGSCGPNLTWSYDAGTLTITGSGSMSYSSGKSPWYAYSRNITKVELPDGLTSIGNVAFAGCTSLTSIKIPDDVTSIGSGAFGGCISLTSIKIPDSVTSIGSSAFSGCESLPSIEIPDGVTVIKQQTFSSCKNLQSIKIPASVTQIGNNAFFLCEKLQHIYYGGTKDQWEAAVANALNWNNGCPSDMKIHYETSGMCGDNLKWSYYAGTLTITGSGDMDDFSSKAPWYDYCDYITKVELPDGLTSIGLSAFYGCGYLKSIEIPDSVTSIGVVAFAECYSLTSIEIPDGVTKIWEETFYKCKNLQSIKIPGSVTEIQPYAFLNCINLQHIYFGGTKDQWAAVEANSRRWDAGSPGDMVVHCLCSVKVLANPTVGGTVSGGGDNCYTYTEVTVMATPNEGCSFVNWKIDGKAVSFEQEYKFTVTGDCTIVANFKIPLTIKAKNQTLTYTGQAQGEKTYNNNIGSIVEVSGLLEGDQLSQVKTTSQGIDVGESEIILSDAVVVNNYKDVTSQYNITYEKGTLTIGPKDVTITTGSDSKTYDGQPLTKDEAKIEGLVNGETATVTATGSQTIKGSSDNTYTIDWGTTNKNNYNVKESLGTLTVSPAQAAITVDNASKVKGEKDPAFTGKVEGLVKDSDLGKISYSRTNTDEDPGTYTGVLTAGYTPNDNYTVTVKNGDFTIKEVFTLKWVDENGSELQTKTYVEGEQPPAYDGKDPVKAATAQYSYTFSGWDSGTVSGTVTTFKPVFTETVNKYKVTFVDEDGKTVLKEAAEYDYGTAADKIEKPKDPTKAADAKNTYTFAGWDPKVADVTGDATYKATYKSTVNKYKVTFVDEDGKTVLKEAVEYEYGTAADKIEKPKDPTKAADAKNTYTFSGWDPKVADVTGDVTYKATYTSTPVPTPTKQGTLTFDLGGGTLDGKTGKITIKANVGDTIKLPGAPTKEGFTFKFWKGSEYAAGAEYKVEGDHAFTAEWEENKFTVKFDVNGHGTAPASQIVKEGMKAIKPNDPTESGYTFGGWYKEKECTNAFDFNTAITEDITLYAKWTKKDNGGSSSGGTSTPSAATTAVKTGDDTPISTWLLILGASALVIAGILVIRKRRKI